MYMYIFTEMINFIYYVSMLLMMTGKRKGVRKWWIT